MARINLVRTRRGDTVTTDGGARGRYVGERRGVVWVVYEDDERADPGAFARCCAAFDARR